MAFLYLETHGFVIRKNCEFTTDKLVLPVQYRIFNCQAFKKNRAFVFLRFGQFFKKKNTGFSKLSSCGCLKVAPTPPFEASVKKYMGSFGSKIAKIGSVQIHSFTFLKLVLYSCDQLKQTFFLNRL